jgi:anti-sigma factor RsiW
MAHSHPLNEHERDNLTAYLDGELDKQSARALEAKLNVNAQARVEAEALRRTWEMLDYLPRPEPSPEFTHRTLERLTVAPGRAAGTKIGGRARLWLVRAGWAAAAVLAVVAGFSGMTHYLQRAPLDPDRQLIEDLHVIQNARLYEQVDDIDFLHKLANADDPDLFGDDNPGS